MEHCYFQDLEHENRLVLKLKPYLAPVLVGVLPLVNKDGLGQMADRIYAELKQDFDAFLDVSGSIGRRYRRLEEIGTPFAITVDRATLEDNTVTVRERDSMEQIRVEVPQLRSYLFKAIRLPEKSDAYIMGS